MTTFTQTNTTVSELSIADLDRVSGGSPLLDAAISFGVNLLYDLAKSGELTKAVDPVGMAQQYANQQKGR